MDFQYEPGRIYALSDGGQLLAEVTFPTMDGIADIDHTYVDDSLRGQGVAGQLLSAAVTQIRRDGQRVKLTCHYAQRWFAQHPEQIDLLAPSPRG